MIRVVLLALLFALVLPAQAQIYRCEKNGTVMFSDVPCGDDGKTVLEPSKPRSTTKNARRRLPFEPDKEVVDACLDAWKPHLNDPRDAFVAEAILYEADGSKYANGKPRHEVFLNARAKNKLGAFVPVRMLCTLDEDGRINKNSVALYQAMQALGVDPMDF
ncbi:MAG: DUF4124 domain-containing protein [Thermodesulfobacteriota bacterium]